MSETHGWNYRWRGKVRGEGKYGRPTYSQASKIIAKFGGEMAFAKAVGCGRITPYRYNYARPYGSDGLIPTGAVEAIEAAARREGILLTADDWAVERINYTPEQEEV